MFQTSRHLQKVIALLTSELTDLRQQRRIEQEQWSEERKQLLDRIMVLTSPGTVRELRPRPPAPEPALDKPTRPNFPGYTVDTRPKSVPLDHPDLSDLQKQAVVDAIKES